MGNVRTNQHVDRHIYWVFFIYIFLTTVLVRFRQKQSSSRNVYIFIPKCKDGRLSPLMVNYKKIPIFWSWGKNERGKEN